MTLRRRAPLPRYSAALLSEALALYASGWDAPRVVAELERRHGTRPHPSWVTFWARRRGLSRPRRAPTPKLTRSEAQRRRRWESDTAECEARLDRAAEVVYRRRELGQTLPEIVAAVGVSLYTVVKYLRRAGLVDRKRSAAMKRFRRRFADRSSVPSASGHVAGR